MPGFKQWYNSPAQNPHGPGYLFFAGNGHHQSLEGKTKLDDAHALGRNKQSKQNVYLGLIKQHQDKDGEQTWDPSCCLEL